MEIVQAALGALVLLSSSLLDDRSVVNLVLLHAVALMPLLAAIEVW